MKSLHDFDTMCFAVKGRNNGHQVYEKMELHMQVCPLFPIHIQMIQAIFCENTQAPKNPDQKTRISQSLLKWTFLILSPL